MHRLKPTTSWPIHEMLFQKMKRDRPRTSPLNNKLINDAAACAGCICEAIIKATVRKTIHNRTVEHAAEINELISKTHGFFLLEYRNFFLNFCFKSYGFCER